MNQNKVNHTFNPTIIFPAFLIRKRILDGIKKFAPQLNGVLLDFGCGSKPYRSLLKVDNYVGLDIADNPGHSHDGEDIDVFYDGKKIPFENNYFDSVFSSEVFEHVFNLEEVLKELNRVTKMDGKMLITCPFAIAEHENPIDFARYTSFGLTHLFKKYGFEVIELEKAGNSVEVVFQLWIMYVYLNLPTWTTKNIVFRIFRKGFIVLFCSLSNLLALFLSWLLPDKKVHALYLNNVVLVKKDKDL